MELINEIKPQWFHPKLKMRCSSGFLSGRSVGMTSPILSLALPKKADSSRLLRTCIFIRHDQSFNEAAEYADQHTALGQTFKAFAQTFSSVYL